MPTCPSCLSAEPLPHRGRPICPYCGQHYHLHNGRLEPLAQHQAIDRLVQLGSTLLAGRWYAVVRSE